MTATDLFGDFCLVCDRQTNGTNFCSQTCRLAQLDTFTGSESSTLAYNVARQAPSHRPTASAGSGFQLPPAYDFTRRQTSQTSLSTSSSSLSTSPPASPKPTTTYSKLPDQVRSDLRDYVGAFDQTRTIRRRVSMQSN